MATLQKLFRRKPVPEMSEETGSDTGQSELELPGPVAQVFLGSRARRSCGNHPSRWCRAARPMRSQRG